MNHVENGNIMDDNELDKMTFTKHVEQTIDDLNEFIKYIKTISDKVLEGDVRSFERFMIEGGTEEGDAKILQIRELLILRYMSRDELIV